MDVNALRNSIVNSIMAQAPGSAGLANTIRGNVGGIPPVSGGAGAPPPEPPSSIAQIPNLPPTQPSDISDSIIRAGESIAEPWRSNPNYPRDTEPSTQVGSSTADLQPDILPPDLPPEVARRIADRRREVAERRRVLDTTLPETPEDVPPPPPAPPSFIDTFDPGTGHLGDHLAGFGGFGNPMGGSIGAPGFVPGFGNIGGDMSMGGGWGSQSAADDARNAAMRRAYEAARRARGVA